MPEQDAQGAATRPRIFWSGTIAFGLVSVPVSLMVANRSAGTTLRMVDRDGTPLGRRYLCSRDEELLHADELVRGYAVDEDRYVTVDDEELEALAPEKSREIDLKRFVPLEQVDPVYFERAYFLVPDRGAFKAYRLLARAMEDVGRAGIATVVMRGKEYLVAIIGERGLLRTETLRFEREVRSPDELGLPGKRDADKRQVRRMAKAMRGMRTDRLDRDLLRDRQQQRLLALVEHKLEQGEDVVAAPEGESEEPPQGAEVIDLMQVLKRSLQGRSTPQRRKPRGRHEALTRQPKAELYRRAQDLGIEGRSRMSKQELIEAIRAAD